jgi:hypothetical protein
MSKYNNYTSHQLTQLYIIIHTNNHLDKTELYEYLSVYNVILAYTLALEHSDHELWCYVHANYFHRKSDDELLEYLVKNLIINKASGHEIFGNPIFTKYLDIWYNTINIINNPSKNVASQLVYDNKAYFLDKIRTQYKDTYLLESI